MTTFRALLVTKTDSNFSVQLVKRMLDDLPEGEVTIRVRYSSINYKDGLAASPTGKVVAKYPIVPGIDLAGTVAASSDSRYKEGDEVLVTGYALGTGHDGGYSEYARVPAAWVVPMPAGLTAREAMVIGTAGFTAALSVRRLEDNGLTPEKGPVLVTGASGGVGSFAVSLLAERGYTVAASTGKAEEHAALRELGASEVVSRADTAPENQRPLEKPLWAGAVDPVGGRTLAYLLSATRYGGSVAVSGMVGGNDVGTTVFPFILRGVNLLGIDSVYCPDELRRPIWEELAAAQSWRSGIGRLTRVISLDELPAALEETAKGTNRGRTIVAL